ncbi:MULTISPECIES: hypothetical protein [unclassified Pseudomonas]|uniref:hypothetical protein n=1 Tax=unclassified Pseudomonas TaxID=196821 RepID=UPI0021BA507E|nr:hypothetical protein [Pseudomonas sp. HD6422]MCT8165608.1 hypothetical protein [Pseudomonas sp. HD6422]MCT8183642.1 hypothetical protein [Pseudomonas sp. HD6421]
MKRTIEGMAKVGEPMLREALEAIRAYRDAEDSGAPQDEVARLKLLADSLYQAVVDFQLLETGYLPDSIH